jgi:hypothetical protein
VSASGLGQDVGGVGQQAIEAIGAVGQVRAQPGQTSRGGVGKPHISRNRRLKATT